MTWVREQIPSAALEAGLFALACEPSAEMTAE